MLEKIMESYQKVALGAAGIGLAIGLTACGGPYYDSPSEKSSSSNYTGEGRGREGNSSGKGGHWECPKK